LIGLSGAIFAERPAGFTVRLNIKHGPIPINSFWRMISIFRDPSGFDLAHLNINVKPRGKNLAGSGV
jgi:hypothetical protein